MPLDPRDRDIAEIAHAVTNDGFLGVVAGIPGMGITVSVGGTMISGITEANEAFAEFFDDLLEQSLGPPSEDESEAVALLRERLATEEGVMKKGVLDRERERDEAFEAERQLAGAEPDADLDRRLLTAGAAPRVINLRDAKVFPASQLTTFDVPRVRVRIGSVDAWWFGVSSLGLADPG